MFMEYFFWSLKSTVVIFNEQKIKIVIQIMNFTNGNSKILA